jgi:hypothetical protein
MSHNNKNARRIKEAREWSQRRLKGEKGPTKTQPQHGKRWTYRKNPDAMKRLAEFVAGIKDRLEKRWGGKPAAEAANI